jgi:hypothetical protein
MKEILVISGDWQSALKLRTYVITALKDNFLQFPSVLLEPEDIEEGAPLRILLEYEKHRQNAIKHLIENAVTKFNKGERASINIKFQAVR